MKVILVGVHNKPHTLPLSWSTKSGKLLQRVIDEFPTILFEKTNLYNVDHMPIPEKKKEMAVNWHIRVKPAKEDIIILLGEEVRKNFIRRDHIILRFCHPASRRSHREMNRYVKRMTAAIHEKI